MKFKYIPYGDSPPVNTVVFGCFFTLNEVTEVNDPAAIAKLKNNMCFERVYEENEETDETPPTDDVPADRAKRPYKRRAKK